MATYVLIPGAGGESWYWHRVVPLLRARGHDVVAPDLPADDDSAGFAEYTDVVVDAIGDRTGLVVVGQSMGGFVAPMVCARVPVDLMVLVAAMVPVPGESGGQWWANTGQERAMRQMAEREGRALGEGFDPRDVFFHDVPPDVTAEAMKGGRRQSDTPFEKPWPLDAWPDVPTRFLLCRHDRLFPAEFQRRVVRERLGIVPDEIDSGHLPALARPEALAERLEAYRAEALTGA
ncbi:Pimeloyl-ACP methyl ester carboxylesterase [Thermomonospora echinospora]|uniref:Pimeloyl-ACP methyl ester carboxylesterase n=1 Tax=Thermomonospora echinospora TaxID=1992 RepID=A0A1H6D5U2_9ACTN|nr:alpha/beta hydrolase [Thermomonospora echinospora]SEG80153.1 Pimeloyl-ACP methyl ester carboxylesterase [Thermomonospora echinospora]